MKVEGSVTGRYRRVQDAFAHCFDELGEVGAAMAVYVGGEKVVDLWGGVADGHSGRPWTQDTLQLVFSTTKGLCATCIAMLVDRGRLSYDERVAAYWPEFGAAGKDEVSLRQLLSHQAGLCAIDAQLDQQLIGDPQRLAPLLARQAPVWKPGTAIGYHGLTIGWYESELVRRVDGRSIGRFFADEVAAKLELQVYIGLPPEMEARVSRLILPSAEATTADPTERLGTALQDPQSLSYRALANPPGLVASMNQAELHAMEIPAANGIGTARDLARLYGILAAGGSPLLGSGALDAAQLVDAMGDDLVTLEPQAYSVGYMKPYGAHPYSPTMESFGHPGSGGSVAFADPNAGLGFAYVMNRMGGSSRLDPRPRALTAAVYECLG